MKVKILPVQVKMKAVLVGGRENSRICPKSISVLLPFLMKRILFICFFITCQNLCAQHYFQKTYGNLLDDRFLGLAINDTDIYVVGYTKENNPNHNTTLFTRLDSDGNIVWLKSVKAGESTYCSNMLPLSNGTLLFTGQTYYCTPGCTYHMLLFNIDTNGNILWEKNWRPANNGALYFGNSIETTDHHIVLCGTSGYWIANYAFGVELIKSDLNGNIVLNKSYFFNFVNEGVQVLEKPNGNYLLQGITRTTFNLPDNDMFVMETDSNGNFLWAKGYGRPYKESGTHMISTINGETILATTSYNSDTSQATADILIIRIDSVGNIIWSKKFGNSANEEIRGILRDSSNNYILWGYTNSFYPPFPGRAMVFKIDGNGNLLWCHLYNNPGGESFYDLKQDHDELLICGIGAHVTIPNNNDGYLVRTDWFGNSCNDTSVVLTSSDVPINIYNLSCLDTFQSYIDTFTFMEVPLSISTNTDCDTVVSVNEFTPFVTTFSAYPNPVSDILTITIENFADAEIIIYDMLGMKVFSTFTKGQNTVNLNLNHFAPGYYLLKMVSKEDQTYLIKKLVKF